MMRFDITRAAGRALRAALPCIVLAISGCGGGDAPPPGSDGALGIPSGTYAIDPTHTYVTFSYLHQGLSYPLIRATRVDGEIELDAEALENSTVAVAIDVESIRTNTPYFDKELASAKFFNAAKYPHVTFVGETYRPVDDRHGELDGTVTIRGIRRPLTLSVTINGAMVNPITKAPTLGISAEGTLNRSEFELDRFIPAVADRVDISIEAEFSLGSSEGSADAVARALGVAAAAGD